MLCFLLIIVAFDMCKAIKRIILRFYVFPKVKRKSSVH
jgi:hypothetical protein